MRRAPSIDCLREENKILYRYTLVLVKPTLYIPKNTLLYKQLSIYCIRYMLEKCYMKIIIYNKTAHI